MDPSNELCKLGKNACCICDQPTADLPDTKHFCEEVLALGRTEGSPCRADNFRTGTGERELRGHMQSAEGCSWL